MTGTGERGNGRTGERENAQRAFLKKGLLRVSKKYVGLCPTPHARCFFEKKHLKNPEKASKINFIVGFCPTTETESTFIDSLHSPKTLYPWIGMQPARTVLP